MIRLFFGPDNGLIPFLSPADDVIGHIEDLNSIFSISSPGQSIFLFKFQDPFQSRLGVYLSVESLENRLSDSFEILFRPVDLESARQSHP